MATTPNREFEMMCKECEHKQRSNKSAMLAIVCITAIELTALFNGINGYAFTLSVGALAGIAGFKFRDLNIKWKKAQD